MLKAGFDPNVPLDAGRRWWEVRRLISRPQFFLNPAQDWTPRRQFQEIRLPRFPLSRYRTPEEAEYIPVAETPTLPTYHH